MTIRSVGVRLWSATRSGDELSALMGGRPSDSAGSSNALVRARFDSEIESEDFADHVAALAGLLERLALGTPGGVSYDLTVKAEDRPLGSMFDFDLRSLDILYRAKCPIAIEMLCRDHEAARPHDKRRSPCPQAVSVQSAGLRLQSTEFSCRQISAVLGYEPSDAWEKGAPVSSRNPHGAVRAHSTSIYESGIEGGALSDHVALLRAILERLGKGIPQWIHHDLVVMAYGRVQGSMVDVDLESMGLLVHARCPITFDVYCDHDEADEQGEGLRRDRPTE